MTKKFLKAAVIAIGGSLALSAGTSFAQEAQSLDQLLKQVQQGRVTDARENAERERRFQADKSQQAAMLAQARQQRQAAEQRSAALEQKFEENELLVVDKQRQLRERMGTLTELFGHLTSAAGDLRSTFETSLVSAQHPNRAEFLDQLIASMAGGERLPSIAEIERLWFEMLREITEGGEVVTFDAEVVAVDGEREAQRVVRVGTFNIFSESGKYLQFRADTGALVELARQPSGPYQGWAADLAGAEGDGLHKVGIDPTGPSGGTFLSALIDAPTFMERVHQGGVIGYITMALGALGALIALWRMAVLVAVGGKVNAQMKSAKANPNNPLGRVLLVDEQNPGIDNETLELKLSEQVLKEVPKLEWGLNFIKIVATVAPLLGLLGTVTGMIVTFQAITIFGAGDPKAMAGGISTALVTTVQGLCVAIPMVLLHTLVNSRAKRIIEVLEERTTGIVAQRTETQTGKA